MRRGLCLCKDKRATAVRACECTSERRN